MTEGVLRAKHLRNYKIIIGLCGKPMSGKGEVRHILESQFGFYSINTKLPLIQATSLLTGIPEYELHNQSTKAKMFRGFQYRQVMGKIGDALETMFGDKFLVERALEPHLHSDGRFVVDALRKKQTVDFPGVVVEVVSHRGIDTRNDFDLYDRSKIDYIIENNGSLGELEYRVSEMLDHFGI